MVSQMSRQTDGKLDVKVAVQLNVKTEFQLDVKTDVKLDVKEQIDVKVKIHVMEEIDVEEQIDIYLWNLEYFFQSLVRVLESCLQREASPLEKVIN